MPKLKSIEFLDGYVIRGTLDDGTVKELDFEPRLRGPVFEPLKDPSIFRAGVLDMNLGTVG